MAEGGMSLRVVSVRSCSPASAPISSRRHKTPVRAKAAVPEDWLCALCHGLLILAFQTDCGCRFCVICLDELGAKESTSFRRCPGSGDDDKRCGPFERNKGDFKVRPKPDKAVDRLIAKVVIVCPNECRIENLCVSYLFTHLRDECPYKYCHQCGKVTGRFNFESDHEIIKCKDCAVDISRCLLESHRNDPASANFCPKFSGLCPYCKAEEIKANEFNLHRPFCEKWKQKCKYEVLGCDGDHKKNLEEDVGMHLSLILRNVISRRLCISERNSMREQSLGNNRQASEDMKYLDETEKKIKESQFTSRIEKAAEDVSSHSNRIEQFHHLMQRVTNSSLYSPTPTPIVPVAPYIWRIPNYLEIKKHESVLDSRPIVSRQYGYKMRVRLYLNGDGQGKGTHLSAYVILMAHDYDNLLHWPFESPFLFTLLDQTQKGQDYQQLIHPNPKSRSFQRPPRTETDVRASGCAKFFPLERLLQHCIYLQDGTLYIKIDILNQPET